MARRFAKVSEEEIEEAFFYPSDLVNTKTTIPLRVKSGGYIPLHFPSRYNYIHYHSAPLWGIVVYYCSILQDPHFHGHADKLLLQSNGWVQWKHLDDVFKQESFYNFCLPQLRSEEYD